MADPALDLDPVDIVDRCARAMTTVLGEAGVWVGGLSAVGDHTHLPIVTSQDHFHRLTASPGSPRIAEFEPSF